MPKDTKERRYLNPALPRTSRLLAYLEEASAETGIAESQLLVFCASEYVRLIVDGSGSGSIPAAPVSPIPATTRSISVPGLSLEPVGMQGSMRTFDPISIGDDENFESFGDPD